MAKKSAVARNEKRANTVSKYAKVRQKLKAAFKNAKASFEDKQASLLELQKLPRNSSPSRLTRRCAQCGRPHAVYRKFGLCRICLRNMLMAGNVPGGRKSSW